MSTKFAKLLVRDAILEALKSDHRSAETSLGAAHCRVIVSPGGNVRFEVWQRDNESPSEILLKQGQAESWLWINR